MLQLHHYINLLATTWNLFLKLKMSFRHHHNPPAFDFTTFKFFSLLQLDIFKIFKICGIWNTGVMTISKSIQGKNPKLPIYHVPCQTCDWHDQSLLVNSLRLMLYYHKIISRKSGTWVGDSWLDLTWRSIPLLTELVGS